MMGEWAAIGLRFAAYADLLLLAGLALGGGLGRYAPVVDRRIMAWLAALGVIITIAQFGATALAMTGNDLAALDRDMVNFLALETPMGLSHLVRIAVLGLLVMSAIVRMSRVLIGLLAVIAVASLAWNGHAGASEATLGLVHRTGDVVHLVAASLWIAALVMFARILLLDCRAPEALASTLSILDRFSRVGAVVVGAIIVTGIINLLAIVGVEGIFPAFGTDYGRLLLLKIALFGGMLGLAALNRWRLVPGARAIVEAGRQGIAVQRLRAAILTETALGLLVLAAVAILGTLSPVG